MLTCAEVIDFVMAYLDRDLPDAQRSAFEGHLAVCPECVAFLKTYEATVRLESSAQSPPQVLPPALIAAILKSRLAE